MESREIRSPAPLSNHRVEISLFVGIYRTKSSFYGFSGDAKWISQPSTVCTADPRGSLPKVE